MSDNDEILAQYVKRLMDVQYGMEEDKLLTTAELKEIALEMGMSEAEYARSQEQAQQFYMRGKTYISDNNYADAVSELTRTVTLSPNHEEGLYLLAKAHMHYGLLNDSDADMKKSELYVDRVLRLSPLHAGALKLKSQKRKGQTAHKSAKKEAKSKRKMMQYILIGGAVLLIIIFHFSITNGMSSAEENVDGAWANVENAYQRRADLVPNLVKTVQGAKEHDIETLETLVGAAKSADIPEGGLTEEAFAQYLSTQKAMENKLIAIVQNTNGTSESFRDLQSQLEGSENRIAVERRKFNEAVRAYNTKCRKFPNSFYRYDTKPYFEMEKGADETPEINFD